MEPFRFKAGTSPLLVSMPHIGTHIPPALASRMTEAALKLPDTDWHLEQLYDFLDDLGASTLAATHSRYVVDLNRAPDNANLYPGQDTTALVPVDTFAREPVYTGAPPDDAEIAGRVQTHWKPYHAKLEQELARIHGAYGYALLWDAHSILSVVPRFFQGKLTDFNLGTVGGASCDAELGTRVHAAAQQATDYSVALNGRFKGGYITRRYGKPGEHVHAIQLELSEARYMNEQHPYAFREDFATRLRPHLRRLLETMLDWGGRRYPRQKTG